MGAIAKLHQLGQSIWYDNIERRLLENGGLQAMVDRDRIRGVTSNPSIFDNAISNSKDYDRELNQWAGKGLNRESIYEKLAVADIQNAADIFRPLYHRTRGVDGYVSLEVSPYLSLDTQGTIEEAQRLWGLVNRPNLMIKIPATRPGLPAIQASIAAGLNVNVTLIFSQERYLEVMDAYISGLEKRVKSGNSIDEIASVASFFVSRIDSKVDAWLEAAIANAQIERADGEQLLGQMAIANARLAFRKYQEVFEGERFHRLSQHGPNSQRPLWASTSTKNPAYSDVRYIEALIGPNTVNTVPPKTLDAFEDHGAAFTTIDQNLDEAEASFVLFRNLGFDFKQAAAELEQEGVKAFADSFTSMLDSIEARRALIVG